MATFSTNQAKHLYVAKAVDSGLDTVGDITAAAAGDKDIVIKYVGNDGVVRSDIINTDNIVYAKAIKASSMAEFLDSSYVAVNTVAANQHYILKVIIDSFSSLSEEDKGFIFADYMSKGTDAAKDILAGLAVNLAKNATKAAYNPLINVYVTTKSAGQTLTVGTDTWKVAASDAPATVAAYGSLAGLVIEAAEQSWTLGKEAFDMLKFNVTASRIVSGGVEVNWATVTKGTTHANPVIKNSKKIADLEWFCMGERGDIYRGMGYPNNFEFSPLVNPAATYGYHVIDIAYFYAGDAEDIQKSPKEIVIVAPAEGDTTYTVINAVAGAINTAAGSTIVATLS